MPCTSNGKVSSGECYLGGGGTTPGATKNTASAEAGTSTIADNSIEINEEGRSVSGTGIPENSYVGTGDRHAGDRDRALGATPPGIAFTGSFELVERRGRPGGQRRGTVTSITLGAESAADDPQYDAYDPALGGGDTGAC